MKETNIPTKWGNIEEYSDTKYVVYFEFETKREKGQYMRKFKTNPDFIITPDGEWEFCAAFDKNLLEKYRDILGVSPNLKLDEKYGVYL